MKFLKFFKLNSLRRKFSIWLLLLMTLTFFIFALILIQNNNKATSERISIEAQSYAELSTKPLVETYLLYYDSGYFKFKEVAQKIINLGVDVKKIQIIDTSGKIVFDSDELANDKHIEAKADPGLMDAITSPTKSSVLNLQNKNEIDKIVYPYFDDWQMHSYSVVYYISYDLVAKNAAQLGDLIIILAIIFMILGAIALYLGLSRLIISPIELVQKGAEKISAGDYKYQLQIQTNDEIERLANSTNYMARTLEADIAKLKHLDLLKDEFISLAAHNLHTPVTHIRLDLDTLIPQLFGKLNDKQNKIVEDIRSSNENLSVLVDDLLNLTTLEKGGLKLLKFSPVDLISIINKVIANYDFKIKEKFINVVTNFNGLSKAEILGDEVKIVEVISNVLDNAVQFNRERGSIVINLESIDSNYQISVQDTGIGMKQEDVSELFKKFHRATSYLTYNYSGKGLGLYIAKLIVEAHNGKIWAESQEGKGSTFYIKFPIKTEKSPIPRI